MISNSLRSLLATLLLLGAAQAAPIDLASVEWVGPGTAGSLGVPSLEVVGLPAVGQPLFDSRISNGLR